MYMKHSLISLFIGVAVALTPLMASALAVPNSAQIAPLVQELNAAIGKLNALNTSHAHLSVISSYGIAPFTTLFALDGLTGTESISFGDGKTTGSDGCTKNVAGWCNLPAIVGHTYAYPALYKVDLYNHVGKNGYLIGTSYVLVM